MLGGFGGKHMNALRGRIARPIGGALAMTLRKRLDRLEIDIREAGNQTSFHFL
jgi:hypothetical protein